MGLRSERYLENSINIAGADFRRNAKSKPVFCADAVYRRQDKR